MGYEGSQPWAEEVARNRAVRAGQAIEDMGGNPIKPAQVNPELLAQRQKFIQGQRDEVNRQATAQRQQADDVIKRRFASMGQSNSGAAIQAQLGAGRELDMNRAAQENQLRNQELAFQQANEESQVGRQMAADQFNKQFDLARYQALLDQGTTEFNKNIASQEANRKPAGLLGQGGFLGTGIGGGK